MIISDVKTDIKNKTIKPYYIFAGDEIEIQRIYINKIAEVMGYNVVRTECIADVWQDIVSPTLFGEPCVYVVRDDKDLMQDEELQSQIEHNRLNGNIIIHLLTTIDKRTKAYKENADKIVLFEHLSTDMLMKYCQKAVTLTNANSERLIAICENDYSRLLLEIDKIKRYCKIHCNCGYDDVFERFVEEGVISTPPKDAIFDLVDAILKHQVERVYDLYGQCKQIGEASMVILSVLYTTAKQVLQVQSFEGDSSSMSKSTGLTGWQIKCAKERVGHYSNKQLVSMLRLIQSIHRDILAGKIEDSMSIEYLLVNVL